MEEKDANIKFLHPSLPSTSFVWPQRDDLCEVLFSNIHSKINVPLSCELTCHDFKCCSIKVLEAIFYVYFILYVLRFKKICLQFFGAFYVYFTDQDFTDPKSKNW